MQELEKIWQENMKIRKLLEEIAKKLGENLKFISEEEERAILDYLERDMLRDFQFSREWRDASTLQLAKYRIIPLLLTACLSMGSTLIYTAFEDTIRKYALYVSLAPLVSNVAGNHGLITAASVTRGLATVKFDNITTLLKEVGAGFICGQIIGILAALVGIIFYHSIPMALTVYLSLSCALMASGFFGTLAPIIFSRMGIDPTRLAGPLETTIQDIVTYGSYFTFLSLFTKLLVH